MSKLLSSEPNVAVILVTFNQWQVTAACLASLQKQTYQNVQIIVVDNASSDETPAQLGQLSPAITYIQNEENLGFAVGCNIGMRHAIAQNADYILLLNNDTTALPNFLQTLVEKAHPLPNLGIASPKILYADGSDRVWFSCSRQSKFTLETKDYGPHGMRSSAPDGFEQVDYIFGTAMLIPVAAIERAGMFDESFFMYYEDMDLCLRFRAHGLSLWYVPQAHLYHHVEQSTKDDEPKRLFYKARSSVLFFSQAWRNWRLPFILGWRSASFCARSFACCDMANPKQCVHMLVVSGRG